MKGYISACKDDSYYIAQEDKHHQYLTVFELLQIVCKLKLPDTTHHEQLIEECLDNLHLRNQKNLTADRLSNSERKRLSIALGMITKPDILFLDEPTTGLDEVSAVQTIRQLKELASQGRTMVCTIHQPSARIFEMFDHIYVLSQGLCVYQGSPKTLIPFLRSIEIFCPKSYNPADFSKSMNASVAIT